MSQGPLNAYLRSGAVWLRDGMRSLGLSPPPEPYLVPALLTTLLTVLIGTAFLFTLLITPSRSSRDSILLIGASPPSTLAPAPGKTTLFHVLRTGHAPPFDTLPTQVPVDANFPVSSALAETSDQGSEPFPLPTSRWVDYPGHSRLRPQMQRYIGEARGVVLVIDASAASFSKTIREAADLLYAVLSNSGFEKSGAPVLVFCNKSETTNSVAPNDVRVRLEAELERARKAKTAALASARNATVQDASGQAPGSESVFLGYEDEVFSFDHVANAVEFARGSATGLDVRPVAEFVASIR